MGKDLDKKIEMTLCGNPARWVEGYACKFEKEHKCPFSPFFEAGDENPGPCFHSCNYYGEISINL